MNVFVNMMEVSLIFVLLHARYLAGFCSVKFCDRRTVKMSCYIFFPRFWFLHMALSLHVTGTKMSVRPRSKGSILVLIKLCKTSVASNCYLLRNVSFARLDRHDRV